MNPAPIPDEVIWPGAQRTVLMPPNNDLDSGISPVEMLVDTVRLGEFEAHRYLARFELTDAEREALAAGGHVWVSMIGQVVPFDANVTDIHGRQVED